MDGSPTTRWPTQEAYDDLNARLGRWKAWAKDAMDRAERTQAHLEQISERLADAEVLLSRKRDTYADADRRARRWRLGFWLMVGVSAILAIALIVRCLA